MGAPSANKPTSKKNDTKQQLIDAAERLFAAQGVDNVSSVDIVRTANQKNRSALQYHFGDKTAIIHAVLDKHSVGIAKIRGAMLDALQQHEDTGLRHLIDCLILPVAKKLDGGSSGHNFLKINSQLMANEAYASLRRERGKSVPETNRFQVLLRQSLPELTDSDFNARLLVIDCILFHGLSTYINMMNEIPKDQFIESLSLSILGALTQK